MNPGLAALGIASLLAWGGLWLLMLSLQKRLDRIEAEDEENRRPPGTGL